MAMRPFPKKTAMAKVLPSQSLSYPRCTHTPVPLLSRRQPVACASLECWLLEKAAMQSAKSKFDHASAEHRQP